MASQKQKRKQKFQEEFLFQKSKISGEDITIEQIKKIKAKCIKTYRQKTYICGTVTEIEIYPLWETRAALKGPAVNPTREEQEKINDRNRRKLVERYINTNFGQDDLWITLGFSNKHLPDSYEDVLKKTRNYLACIKRAAVKQEIDLKYIYVIEKSSRGRYHIHIVTNFRDRKTIEDKWKWGRYSNTRRIQTEDGDISGLANYMTKEIKEKKHQRHYGWSKNLKKPTVYVNDVKIKKTKAEKFVRDENEFIAYIKKEYPEARNIEPMKIRFSDYTDGVYLSSKFIRPQKRNKGKG